MDGTNDFVGEAVRVRGFRRGRFGRALSCGRLRLRLVGESEQLRHLGFNVVVEVRDRLRNRIAILFRNLRDVHVAEGRRHPVFDLGNRARIERRLVRDLLCGIGLQLGHDGTRDFRLDRILVEIELEITQVKIGLLFRA